MSEEQAHALAADIERTPGWLAERVESVNHLWYVLAGRDADPLTHFVLRSRRDWERVCELLNADV
jgi:hypothetical protein